MDDDDGEFAFFSSFLRAMQKTWHSSVYGHSAFPLAETRKLGLSKFFLHASSDFNFSPLPIPTVGEVRQKIVCPKKIEPCLEKDRLGRNISFLHSPFFPTKGHAPTVAPSQKVHKG